MMELLRDMQVDVVGLLETDRELLEAYDQADYQCIDSSMATVI